MHRLFFDTCVLVDLAVPARPRHASAAKLLARIAEHPEIRTFALASSLKNVYYILCRHYSAPDLARERTRMLADTFEIEELTRSLLKDAFSSDEPDFEDALVRVAAQRISCDFIVTEDRKDFAPSSVKKATIDEALAAMG